MNFADPGEDEGEDEEAPPGAVTADEGDDVWMAKLVGRLEKKRKWRAAH